MNGPLMMLGPHQFYVDWLNFQSFDEEFSASWVTMPRFGVAPGLQFGDRAAVDAVTMTIRAAQAVPLISWASGGTYAATVHGRVVITSIQKDHDFINRYGQSQRIRYSISLLPFFDGGKPQGQYQEGQYQ